MNDVLPIIGVAAIAFLATNADNLLLLFAFLADRSFKPWQVIVGYALGMVAILALSWLVAWFAHFLRPDYVGFLGVVPIGLGLKRLYDRFVRHAGSAEPASSRALDALPDHHGRTGRCRPRSRYDYSLFSASRRRRPGCAIFHFDRLSRPRFWMVLARLFPAPTSTRPRASSALRRPSFTVSVDWRRHLYCPKHNS